MGISKHYSEAYIVRSGPTGLCRVSRVGCHFGVKRFPIKMFLVFSIRFFFFFWGCIEWSRVFYGVSTGGSRVF